VEHFLDLQSRVMFHVEHLELLVLKRKVTGARPDTLCCLAFVHVSHFLRIY
jgi:hypothetical protein